MKKRTVDAIGLLKELIQTPSMSGEEQATGDLIAAFLTSNNIVWDRLHNNIIAKNEKFDPAKKTIVLNSHHDTVKVGSNWTQEPFGAKVENGKLFGRGSNDAGGCLVSLIAVFCHFYTLDLPFNLVLIASGEEENFGNNGVSSVLSSLDFTVDLGIIGEPTQMKMGVAEKGLIVVDAEVKGKAGHAARDNGTNALYLALEDIDWIRNYDFDRVSTVLGPTKMTVTQIGGGHQHNVIPDMCKYLIDVRVNEHYSLEELIELLDENCKADFKPRSLRWRPSSIPLDHPLVIKGEADGLAKMGSPTLSDQVHFTCPTIKIGPGKSERSHTADEFIILEEIESGIDIYIQLLTGLTI